MDGVLRAQSHLPLGLPLSHSAIAPPRPLGWEKRCRLGFRCCFTRSCSCSACGGFLHSSHLGLVVRGPARIISTVGRAGLFLLLLSRPVSTVTQQSLCCPSLAWCDSWLLLGKILRVTTLPTIPVLTTSLAPRLPQECWLTLPCLASAPSTILMNPKSSWPGALCLLGVSQPLSHNPCHDRGGTGLRGAHTLPRFLSYDKLKI